MFAVRSAIMVFAMGLLTSPVAHSSACESVTRTDDDHFFAAGDSRSSAVDVRPCLPSGERCLATDAVEGPPEELCLEEIGPPSSTKS